MAIQIFDNGDNGICNVIRNQRKFFGNALTGQRQIVFLIPMFVQSTYLKMQNHNLFRKMKICQTIGNAM